MYLDFRKLYDISTKFSFPNSTRSSIIGLEFKHHLLHAYYQVKLTRITGENGIQSGERNSVI